MAEVDAEERNRGSAHEFGGAQDDSGSPEHHDEFEFEIAEVDAVAERLDAGQIWGMGDDVPVLLAVGDGDDSGRSQPEIPGGPEHPVDGIRPQWTLPHDPLADAGPTDLELWFHEEHKVGLESDGSDERGEHQRQRDDGEIGDDEARAYGLACGSVTEFARHEAGVETLDHSHSHSRVGGDLGGELAVADIEGDHAGRIAFEQNLSEAAGRGPDIEGGSAGDRYFEGVEGRDELVRGAARLVVGRGDRDCLVVRLSPARML